MIKAIRLLIKIKNATNLLKVNWTWLTFYLQETSPPKFLLMVCNLDLFSGENADKDKDKDADDDVEISTEAR